MKCSFIKLDKLSKLAGLTAITWVVIQVFLLIIAWNHELSPDSKEYISNALFSYQHHVLYPSEYNLYDKFTHAPGIVNYLLLLYACFGHFKVAMIFNLLMNIVILYEVYYLAEYFFNRRVACLSVILYCSIISIWFVPLHILSDHPSYFLFLSAFCLSIQKKWYFVVFAGVLYALGYTIKPTVLAYLVPSVVFLLVYKRSILSCIILLVPYFGLLHGIGKYYEHTIGTYTNTSHITGFGMMHSANEKTWAGPDMSFSYDPNNSGYIENADHLTFAEKDSIWRSRSIIWVKNNPERYLLLAPQRFIRSFALDYWSLQDVFETNQYENAIHSPNPYRALKLLRLQQFLVSIPYYCVLLLFVLALWVKRRSVFSEKGILLLITLLYTGTTFLLLAEHRSHYAFLFPIVIWAAYGLEVIVDRKSNKNEFPSFTHEE